MTTDVQPGDLAWRNGEFAVVAIVYDNIPGGVKLDREVEGFTSWNVRELTIKRLTENQREIIDNLAGEDDDGLQPMHFGGSNGSHHSNTATRLCAEPYLLVERRLRGLDWGDKRRMSRSRGSYCYRLTERGVAVARVICRSTLDYRLERRARLKAREAQQG